MSYRSFSFSPTMDGQTPIVHCWAGDDPVRGAIVIAHGMGEHALRYASLADALAREGYTVYANDHRGHGQTVKDASQLGDYGPEGWRGLIDDQRELLERVGREHPEPGIPILLVGHSMGSMIVQHILTEASDLIDGAALSGTTAVDVMAAATTQNDPDADLFAAFNQAFEPVRTESDWLSRDPEQVDLYVEDPLCGFTVTEGSINSLMEAGVGYSSEASTKMIRKDLPIYLFAGEADPVGAGGALVTRVAERYRKAGIEDVELKLYPDARHEVFNETNRKEVEADFIAWANRVRDSKAASAARSDREKGTSA